MKGIPCQLGPVAPRCARAGLAAAGETPEGGWRAVVAITRGGMAPAMIVARELDIRTVDTISVKSYDHQTQARRWSSSPPTRRSSATAPAC